MATRSDSVIIACNHSSWLHYWLLTAMRGVTMIEDSAIFCISMHYSLYAVRYIGFVEGLSPGSDLATRKMSGH